VSAAGVKEGKKEPAGKKRGPQSLNYSIAHEEQKRDDVLYVAGGREYPAGCSGRTRESFTGKKASHFPLVESTLP